MDQQQQDWQTSKPSLTKRGEHLLSSGKWADCHFVLGQESGGQQTISGHKLILAMASPVFEAMFYGELAEKDEPIPILDIRPDAFRALLVYIYTDVIQVDTVDKACELCYAAKKYMLWHVVETCTNFIFKDLRPANVCRAYEFARLFEEPRLMKNCMTIICTRTMEVLEDPSFDEADVNTVLTIVEQNVLNIHSELSLFNAISRYAADKQLLLQCTDACPEVVVLANESNEEDQGGSSSSSDNSSPPAEDCNNKERSVQMGVLRRALQKIRFLTLTPQEFAEGPGKSTLLTQNEAFHILMNISSGTDTIPMPDGFTATREHRTIGSFEFRATQPLNQGPHDPLELFDIPNNNNNNNNNASSSLGIVPSASLASSSSSLAVQAPHPDPLAANNHDHNDNSVSPLGAAEQGDHVSRRYYCFRFIRTQTDCLNTSILDCSLTFSVDRSICITGCQVPTQVLGGMDIPPMQGGNFPERYSELLYAHLLDSLGSRLTYTHCTSRVRFDTMLEISFDRPVYVQKDKVYKIGVVFNKVGWYPMSLCVPTHTCANVCFTFGVGSHESVRDGLIRAIVFKFPNEI